MADIFLSYAKEDRALAETVVSALRKRGFTVWWDDQIEPNAGWDQIIERELESSLVVLALWTARSITSEAVRAEATYAKDKAHKLIQAMYGVGDPPVFFSMRQYANLSDWKVGEPHERWERLVCWISEKVGAAPQQRKALDRFRQHFMEATGDGITAYNSISMHTPIRDMLEDFDSCDEFVDVAWQFCVESGAHSPPQNEDDDDWLPDELICLYNEQHQGMTVGHLVNLVRERTRDEHEQAARSGAEIEALLDQMIQGAAEQD